MTDPENQRSESGFKRVLLKEYMDMDTLEQKRDWKEK